MCLSDISASKCGRESVERQGGRTRDKGRERQKIREENGERDRVGEGRERERERERERKEITAPKGNAPKTIANCGYH